MMNLQKDKWEKVKMGSKLFAIIDGDRGNNYPKEKDFFSEGFCLFLNAKNVTKAGLALNECQFITKEKDSQLRKGKLERNDIVITTRGTIGNVAFFDKSIPFENIRINSGMVIFRSNSEYVLIPYLYTAIRAVFEEKNIRKFITGTAQPQLPIRTINNIEIPLPPLDEQQRVAELFQSVEQSTLQAEKQEENLKLLQKSLSNGLASNPPVFGNLLSKKNCKPCSFSNIAECIEEHNKTPLDNGLTRFVGLENIEPENFTLQGFGNIENGTTFTKQFTKGDVLFGKRRAYLKKVAVADFDGICSSDILVFRAIEKEILPELLSYYVSSDAFMNLAVSTSAGSLSPRTKWRDLAGFQLFIPDIKIQEKIVDIFRQLSQSLQLVGQQKETLKKLKQKLLNEILG